MMKELAAGGVVYRSVGNEKEILMIVDRYGEIALAKGKMEPGETIEQTALREIEEETGIVGRLDTLLEQIHYQYEHPVKGTVDKEVHYYLVEAIGGETRAQAEEVQQVEWLSLDAAWSRQLQSRYRNNDAVMHKALLALDGKHRYMDPT